MKPLPKALTLTDRAAARLKELMDTGVQAAITDLIERHEKGDYPDVCKRCTYFVSVYNSRKSRTFDAQGNPTGNWSE